MVGSTPTRFRQKRFILVGFSGGSANEREVCAEFVPQHLTSGPLTQIFKSMLDLIRRAVWIDFRSWRFRSSSGSGSRQDEQGTPADFLIEFGTTFLECQPYSFHWVFGRHLADGAVHLQHGDFRSRAPHRQEADAENGPTTCRRGASEHWHAPGAERWEAECPSPIHERTRHDTVRIKANQFTRNPHARLEYGSTGGLVGKSSGCCDPTCFARRTFLHRSCRSCRRLLT